MRFASALIPILFSASTVLAFSAYAGYRVGTRGWFKSVSADVILPPIWSDQCSRDSLQLAFIGIAMGDPTSPACDNTGVEAGVVIVCDIDGSTRYIPYVKAWPHEEQSTDTSQFPTAVGDKIRIEIWIQDATEEYGIQAAIDNLTQPGHRVESAMGSAFDIVHCTRTAAWVLRANQVGFHLLPIPDFKSIHFVRAWAEDSHSSNVYLPASDEAEVLIMTDYDGFEWAEPADHISNIDQDTELPIDPYAFHII